MYITCKLFILELRLVVRSMLFILYLPDLCPDFTLFYLSLTGIDVCLSTVEIAIASLKVKRKASGLPHKFLEMWKGIS